MTVAVSISGSLIRSLAANLEPIMLQCLFHKIFSPFLRILYPPPDEIYEKLFNVKREGLVGK
ncbi:hypothetical protein RRF57_000326 [Xylaria bambusicola]|uniref:Uncharacterized protein n=1 Tax=Xylaria bambusicola TaxID=326684 RepID=A0AAN7U3M4_9PEZI